MLGSVLVANRGEIAARLVRGYREIGVRSVAVYSEADAGALHVRLADAAQPVGPAPVAQSYLDGERVLRAALAAGVDAVDPGYGLLSENAGFARAVRDAGLAFVGPTPEAIAAMGDKVAARAVARRAAVPVVPGSDDAVGSVAEALEVAEAIGYPVLVKTSFGGGGRGLRLAEDPSTLSAALESAGREAGAAFGRSEVYLERHVRPARHVEVQVLGDTHGTLVCLADRDCSVQRRHQKLLEEAPAPFLEPELRAELADAALRLARHARYTSTGTVEFLVQPDDGTFFFLEMNTRLQVEHGVTELVTGVDLVAARWAVACGQPLDLGPSGPAVRGHAIEVRLAAEDPVAGFRPRPGVVSSLRLPAGAWLRCDFGVEAGDRIPAEYDSLFGTVMAWGPDRESARRRLVAALGELRVSGVPTTAAYLRDVLQRPEFVAGQHTVSSVESDWPPDPDVSALPTEVVPGVASDVADQAAPGRQVVIQTLQGPLHLLLPGPTAGSAAVGVAAPAPSGAAPVAEWDGGAGRSGSAADGQPRAPIDGTVASVAVGPGTVVAPHAVLLVLEAMKMEIPVMAAAAGRVGEVLVAVGDAVTVGQLLLRVDRLGSEVSAW